MTTSKGFVRVFQIKDEDPCAVLITRLRTATAPEHFRLDEQEWLDLYKFLIDKVDRR